MLLPIPLFYVQWRHSLSRRVAHLHCCFLQLPYSSSFLMWLTKRQRLWTSSASKSNYIESQIFLPSFLTKSYSSIIHIFLFGTLLFRVQELFGIVHNALSSTLLILLLLLISHIITMHVFCEHIFPAKYSVKLELLWCSSFRYHF
ncbi:hypothetical protein AHAS_Ahas18G0115700 [Arachis hypogaea]